MRTIQQTPNQSLNKAYRKEKVGRSDIERFKTNLKDFLGSINEKESEEHVKNNVTKFLYDTYYNGKNQVNTKGRIDLAIYEDKKPVVLFEAKRPGSADMVTTANLNTKAFHELILYYLRERIDETNTNIKYVVATDMYQWFVFDAVQFDRLFYQNNQLTKEYVDWKNGRKADTSTDFFYTSIALPFLKKSIETISFTWFDLREFDTIVHNEDEKDDVKLVPLFKLLAPAHLLKQPFANDSNSLDTKFYSELLHIIGLEEKKDGGRKLIQRKEKPDPGSLLENTITLLEAEDRLRQLPREGADFGDNKSERLFNVALELCITWINRVLFLKLLEGQLVIYHAGDARYQFLNFKIVPNYDELNKLFFQVLALKHGDRSTAIREKFQLVPYLNSSLFEISSLERDTLRINSLDDSIHTNILKSTVLKDNARRREGQMPTLQYLFEFLSAYDFTSEGKEEIQEENKGLINASVLGLIFEKINGYKDGSFFTPGFITMHMSRDTIRRAVVQKFNEAKGWNVESFDDLHNRIKDVKEANGIVNSLKICDPAVGSGHFLVSALNELIAIKSELHILTDRDSKLLRDYNVQVVNDELMVEFEPTEFFEYRPGNKESQRVQEALFHEKQTIIENCLFGVDINPNSVKICRLRLWIELLKNAYYTSQSKFTELETLPNIDINIKQGNSLISRFGLDADLSKPLKSIKYGIDQYRAFVNSYKNATDKEEKRGFEKLIEQIKGDFRTEIVKTDPKMLMLNKKNGELFNLINQAVVFEPSDKEKKERQNKKAKLEAEIGKLTAEITEIRESAIYKDAFEWRFEFPEVLNEQGVFLGFDLLIGNPPYISHDRIQNKSFLKHRFEVFEPYTDLYSYFVEMGLLLTKDGGLISLITSNSFLRAEYGRPLREFIVKKGTVLSILNFEDAQIFQDATVNACIITIQNRTSNTSAKILSASYDLTNDFSEFVSTMSFTYDQTELKNDNWNFPSPLKVALIRKIKAEHRTLEDFDTQINLGIATGANDVFLVDREKYDELIRSDEKNTQILKPILRGRDVFRYSFIQPELWVILARNEINIKDEYPSVYDHLDKAGDSFKRRGAQGKHWTNLRACSFFDDFKKEKIIWIELSDVNRFALCEEEVYLLNTAYFLVPPQELSSKYLLGLLNSKLIRFYLNLIANTSGVGTTRWFHIYVKKLPIAAASPLQVSEITQLVNQILERKKSDPNAKTTKLEADVDKSIYKLYGLSSEDIAIIEEEFSSI